MKKEIYFPKGAKSINFDLEKGIATAIYKEEKPALKVGEWYIGDGAGSKPRLFLGGDMVVGFSRSGEWNYGHVSNPSMWKPADMSKVKELLIKEAEKMGFKKGASFRTIGYKSMQTFTGNFMFSEGSLYDNQTYYKIFDFRTGKWAEIVEEKKPLYVNQYGTEFFDGDEFYFIDKSSGFLLIDGKEGDVMEAQLDLTEALTKKECLKVFREWLNS